MCEGGTGGAIVFGFVEACLRIRHFIECMNGGRTGGPPKLHPRGIYSLGLQTSSSLATRQQVRRRQKSSKQARRACRA